MLHIFDGLAWSSFVLETDVPLSSSLFLVDKGSMVDFQPFLNYLKRPFEMGLFWKWRVVDTRTVDQVKKENRASVVTTRSRGSVLSKQSVLSNTPKVAPWEVIVDQHLAQCLRAAKVRDFTYFRLSAALSAQPELEKIDYKASLLSIIYDDAPLHALESLNKDKCDAISRGFKEYVGEIERAKEDQLSWLEWGRLLDSEEERVIEVLTAKIKETSEEAKNIITNLEHDARDIAASAWVQGSNVTMGCFRTLCSQIKIVSERVGEFERGEFGILGQAGEKVESAVEAGIIAVFDRSDD